MSMVEKGKSMSTVTIELDAKVVQDAINAHVRPAVDKVLAKYDLPKLIAEQLHRAEMDCSIKVESRSHIAYIMAFDYLSRGSGEPMINALLQQAIHDAAKAYIDAAVAAERPKLEAAFKKMMKGSSDRLARQMFKALEGEIGNGWTFSLRTEIEADRPSSDD